MFERIYWFLSALAVFAFTVLVTGCGGSSQQDEQQTKQDLQTEANELFHQLNPTFVGPIVIPDPQAYIIEHAQGH